MCSQFPAGLCPPGPSQWPPSEWDLLPAYQEAHFSGSLWVSHCCIWVSFGKDVSFRVHPKSRETLLAEALFERASPPLKLPHYRRVALGSSFPVLPTTEVVTGRLAQGLLTFPAVWISAIWDPASRKTGPCLAWDRSHQARDLQ